MRFIVGVHGLAALALALPLATYAQSPCSSGSSSFIVEAPTGYIAPQQSFQATAQVCAFSSQYPAGTVVTFNIIDLQMNRLVATYRGSTDANGTASTSVSGLPSDDYEVDAVLGPSSISGGAETSAYFTVGGGQGAGAVQGPFVFLLQGFTPTSDKTNSAKAAVAGVFTADGNGNITTGEADLNSVGGTYQKIPITGHYTLNQSGLGKVYLSTPLGNLTLSIATSPVQAGSALQSAIFTALTPTAIYGSGTIVRQDRASSAQLTFPSGLFSVRLTGETTAPSVPLTVTGQFSLNVANGTDYLEATVDQTVGATVQPNLQVSGTAGPIDASGRSVLTFASSGGFGSAQLATYQTDAAHFYVLSLNPHSGAALLSGSGAQ